MFKIKRLKKFFISVVYIFLISENIYANAEGASGINYISYFGNLLFFLIIFALIIFLALYVTKFISRKTNSMGKGKNLIVLDFVNLSGNVKLVTVKIYKKIYILSIANNHTTVVDKLNEEDLDMDFEDYLNHNLTSNQDDIKVYYEKLKEKISEMIKKSPKDEE